MRDPRDRRADDRPRLGRRDGRRSRLRRSTRAAQLTPSGAPIALPAPAGLERFPRRSRSRQTGARRIVADNLGDAIVEIDLASRSVAAIHAGRRFSALRCRMRATSRRRRQPGSPSYSALASPAPAPQFTAPAFDPVEVVGALGLRDHSGSTSGDPARGAVWIRRPTERRSSAERRPARRCSRADGGLAYIALANVDRVAVVSSSARRASFAGWTFGSIPAPRTARSRVPRHSAPNGKRLYVALAGSTPSRFSTRDGRRAIATGLIPTGWYPTALALSHDGRYLYVLNAKGVDGWRPLQRVDLKRTYLVRGDAGRAALQPDARDRTVQSGHSTTALEQAQRRLSITSSIIAVGSPRVRRDARRSQGRSGAGPRQRRPRAERSIPRP